MNLFNAEAGATPAPSDPAVLAIVERAAAVIWRAFPYFAWRFDGRGRAFGRSDAGYLTTLVDLAPAMQQAQVVWLVRVLTCRGMPSFLLEAQLDVLARVGRRARWAGAGAMSDLAVHLHSQRQQAMSDAHLRACDRQFGARAGGPFTRRRAIGALIAAEVADRRLGYLEGADATLNWLLAKCPEDAAGRRPAARRGRSPRGGEAHRHDPVVLVLPEVSWRGPPVRRVLVKPRHL